MPTGMNYIRLTADGTMLMVRADDVGRDTMQSQGMIILVLMYLVRYRILLRSTLTWNIRVFSLTLTNARLGGNGVRSKMSSGML